jgi:uncharacterized protein YcbK (DUF882 family)
MGDLSENFSKSEFACKCGCGYGLQDGDVSPALVFLLEAIREDVGGPVRLTSGCRCPDHNQAVGGVPDSVHTLGEAADIQVEGGRHRFMVQRAAHDHGAEGIGTAKGFIHVDTHKGDVKARPSAWSY